MKRILLFIALLLVVSSLFGQRNRLVNSPDENGAGLTDSTRIFQDSIIVYFQNGVEVGRDTLAVSGSGSSFTDSTIRVES
ncbi:MAG: hypothetical protein AAFY41_19120, partial [Bacteroidota bacterium]